ncbi:uncharacterized protein O3C94_002177 [Discoglossus pictus]
MECTSQAVKFEAKEEPRAKVKRKRIRQKRSQERRRFASRRPRKVRRKSKKKRVILRPSEESQPCVPSPKPCVTEGSGNKERTTRCSLGDSALRGVTLQSSDQSSYKTCASEVSGAKARTTRSPLRHSTLRGVTLQSSDQSSYKTCASEVSGTKARTTRYSSGGCTLRGVIPNRKKRIALHQMRLMKSWYSESSFAFYLQNFFDWIFGAR